MVQLKRLGPLQESNIRLWTYTGESIKVLGTSKVNVMCSEQQEEIVVHVVDRDRPNLLGRDWFTKIKTCL